MSLPVLKAIVRKDLKVFFSDRRAVFVSLILPIVLASFFGFLFGGAKNGTPEANRIDLRLVDEDQSAMSRQLVADLTGDKALAVKPVTADVARTAVREGDVAVAVLLPKGFGDEVTRALAGAAPRPSLSVLYDPSHIAERAMVQGIVTRHVMDVLTGGKGEGPQLPYEVREEAVTAGKGVRYNGYAHSFSGMGVQFILMACIEGAMAVLLQRQRGLWKRLRAAPLSRLTMLGARMVSSALIALLILTVLFGFGKLAFGVRVQGSFPGFVAVCVATALMAAGFGLLVAALGKTPEATRGVSVFVMLVIVMLGGAWVPSFLFPTWLQKVASVTPTKWAIDGLDAMLWRGLGVDAALAPVAVLLGFAALFGLIAVWRFRWEADG